MSISAMLDGDDASQALPHVLMALVDGVVAGVVAQLVLTSREPYGDTFHLAQAVGAEFVCSDAETGARLARGLAAARRSHVLVVDAITPLPYDWLERLGDAPHGFPAGFRRKPAPLSSQWRHAIGFALAGEAFGAILVGRDQPLDEKAATFATAFPFSCKKVRSL